MLKSPLQKIAALCLLVNLLTILSIVLLKKNLPPVVPLFYGLPVSIDELTPELGLAIPSVVSIILIIINYLIVKLTKDKFLERIAIGLIISITALSLITIIKTIFLVGSF